MKFCSTRGQVQGATFEAAISRGYAPDGGLFVPEELPQLSPEELEAWRELSFPELAEALLAMFVGDEVEEGELHSLVCSAYQGFTAEQVVPVVRVGGLLVVELFHGPTFCFKDLGLQPLIRLIAHFAEKREEQRTMIVATTGDTGPAAMRAVSDAGSPNMKIVVFFPEGQISELQRRQMTTCSSDRARVSVFQGGGDDMDAPIKRMGADKAFADRHGICGVNSTNIGRPICQLVHYFWAYFRALDEDGLDIGSPVDIVLPSGALGNMTAGFMAKCMGLPLGCLVAGVNSNDITHRTFSAGEFHRSEAMEKTLSDAINIQVPYNMERVFYYLTCGDSSLVCSWMAEMERSGRFTLPDEWLQRLQALFRSRRVDDDAMCQALRHGAAQHGYLADPHTAVALSAAWHLYGEEPEGTTVAVLATASPCKFEVAVTTALGASSWDDYLQSDGFPEAARAALQAEETPPGLLRRGSGTLEETQRSWEAQVRSMLDGALGQEGPQSKL